MAFANMYQELLGSIPGSNLGLVKTKINEAFTSIQNENVWSFQLRTGGWLAPGLLGGQGVSGVPNTTFLSPGTITVTPYTNTITGDAVATAAWIATIPNPPLITQYQIRVPYYSIYSVVALSFAGTVAYLNITSAGSGQTPGVYSVAGVGGSVLGSGAVASITVNGDGTVTLPPIITNPGTGYIDPSGTPDPPTFTLAAGGVPATFTAQLNAVLTIDRPWMDPLANQSSYMAYVAYFPAPPGFKRWYYVSDYTNNNSMDWWSKTQVDLSNDDAERTIFDQPFFVVPYAPDTRTGSATYGQMLFELWPAAISEYPYNFGCQCNWPALVNPTDTLPYPLTEECVKWRAYEVLALWKEGMKGDDMERGSGANWQFLSQAAHSEYLKQLKLCRNMDRNLVDLYFTKARVTPPYGGEPFSTVQGLLNVGSF